MSTRNWLSANCFICKKEVSEQDAIVINDEKDLIFCSEECLQQYFMKYVDALGKETKDLRSEDDIAPDSFDEYSNCLDGLLEDPDEIWEDLQTFEDLSVHHFVGEFSVENESVYYVASVYMTDDSPTFVFSHFPTKKLELVEQFRRGRLIFDRSQSEIEIEASEDDALAEGDELARGLFQAMLRLRSASDIAESEFASFLEHRQNAIEECDEMWRSNDLQGNTLVTFIKDISEENEEDLYYVVVTIEDVVSGSHFILFSFPTKDTTLVDRYRHGQNLGTEGLTRTESH